MLGQIASFNFPFPFNAKYSVLDIILPLSPQIFGRITCSEHKLFYTPLRIMFNWVCFPITKTFQLHYHIALQFLHCK